MRGAQSSTGGSGEVAGGYGEEAALCALESAASHIARCKAASNYPDECGTPFAIAFFALLGWGEKHGFIRDESSFLFLNSPPYGYGDEHEAWFNACLNLWFKTTSHYHHGTRINIGDFDRRNVRGHRTPQK